MPSSTIDAVRVADTADRLRTIRDFIETEWGLVGRRTEMHIMQVAITAKLHVILHGLQGRAKSMTVDAITKQFKGVKLFKTQAYKASPPEQFLGPISIKGMENDEFVRIVTGRLPDAEVAIIDELPRAPRAILPAFQGMMVEREFDMGRGVEPVPLWSLIGTSNHLPDDPELAAFFDRFALKLVVQAPASQEQFTNIMRGALARDLSGTPRIPDELMIERYELEEFQRAVCQVVVPDDVLDAYGELWANLLAEGIEPSVRRYVDVTKGMRSIALINGRNEVEIDDMQVAQHALWTSEDEIPAVYAATVQFASEWVKEKAKLVDAFAETLDRIGQVQSMIASGADSSTKTTIGDDEKSLTDHALKFVNDSRKLQGLVAKHVATASAGQDVSELESIDAQIDAGRTWVQDRILGGLAI